MVEQYWQDNVPWSFNDLDEKPSYQERRKMRYSLQDYMHTDIFSSECKGKSILEVGCGSGLDAAEFARMGAKVTAVDPSRLAIKEAEQVSLESGLMFPVEKAEADCLPFQDCSFDMVYSFGVLHHLKDPETALTEFKRVLKPGGEVIGMLYHSDGLLYPYSIRHLGLPCERNGNPFTRLYSKRQAFNLFSRFFRDVSVDVRFNVIDMPNQRKVKLSIPDSLELGWHLIVKGRKP